MAIIKIQSMNFFQRASLTASFFVITFIVTGFALNSIDETNIQKFIIDHISSVMLAIFMINFRIKVLFDDHVYFGHDHTLNEERRTTRICGFFLGIYSWIFWGFSSFSITHVERACGFLIIAITFTVAWITVHLRELKGSTEKFDLEDKELNIFWIFTNSGYAALIGLFSINFLAIYGSYNYKNAMIFIVLHTILFIDAKRSRSYKIVI